MGFNSNQLFMRPSPDELFQRSMKNSRPVSSYQTPLTPMEEALFQSWVKGNSIPFDPGPKSDYDMRGFYRGLMSGDPRAQNAVDPNDGRMHFPDTWKTPYHETFSRESQYASPNGPSWTEDDKLVSPIGRILFDDRNR